MKLLSKTLTLAALCFSSSVLSETVYLLDIPSANYADCNTENFSVERCANSFDAHLVFRSQGDESSLINITFNPVWRDGEAFTGIITLPHALPVTSAEHINTKPIPLGADISNGDAFSSALAEVGGEIAGELLGAMAFPINLFISDIPTTSDPSFIRQAFAEGRDPYLARQYYPHSKFTYNFQRDNLDISSQISLNVALPLYDALALINTHGMGIYIGGAPTNELLVDGITFTASDSDISSIKIKNATDASKGSSFAAKLTWNPGTFTWERQLVLYNGVTEPARDHEAWMYLMSISAPDRQGIKDWESFGYTLYPY
ncbi:hypothetical protein ACFL2V_12830 [Pseudomonadota bacterium]